MRVGLLPFWDAAVGVAERLPKRERDRIRATCRDDIRRSIKRLFPRGEPSDSVVVAGRFVLNGRVARYVWRGDNAGGIYLLCRSEEEDEVLRAATSPPKQGSRAHLELSLHWLEDYYWSLDVEGQNALIRRRAHSSTEANYIPDRNLLAELEDRLGLNGCLYRLENDYEAWFATLSDTWFPEGFSIATVGADEPSVRGAAIVQYAYAREHPFMIEQWKKEHAGKDPPWPRW